MESLGKLPEAPLENQHRGNGLPSATSSASLAIVAMAGGRQVSHRVPQRVARSVAPVTCRTGTRMG